MFEVLSQLCVSNLPAPRSAEVHLGPNITGRRVGRPSSPAVFISWLAAQ